MAGIPISGLPPIATPEATDIFPTVQSGVTYQETITQLATLLVPNLPFLPLAGGTMTGGVNMGGNQINNMADPTLAQDAATKHYVDAVASGIIILPAAAVATTANLTATYNNGASGVGATLTNSGTQVAFSVDGVSPANNSIVLVKNQTTTPDNGIYTLTTVGTGSTNWVLTRSTNYDTAGQIVPGTVVVINAGTVNAATTWIQTATVTTVGTDPILFSLFNANIYAMKGANADITSMSGLTGYLQAPLGVKDASGNTVEAWNSTASAVNYVSVLNNGTGFPPTISALGSDTNIVLQLNGKGTGGAQVKGTSTNDNAPAGYVGEYISASVLAGSPISISSSVVTNICSINLTAGDWDLRATTFFLNNGTTNYTFMAGGISTTSSAFGVIGAENNITSNYPGTNAGVTGSFGIGPMRLSLSTTTPVYLVAEGVFSVTSTAGVAGFIGARRIR